MHLRSTGDASIVIHTGVLLMKRFLGRAEQQDVVDRISAAGSAANPAHARAQKHAHPQAICQYAHARTTA